jgi:hypothetical protein
MLLGDQTFEPGSQVHSVIMKAQNVSETLNLSTLTAAGGQRFGAIYAFLLEM